MHSTWEHYIVANRYNSQIARFEKECAEMIAEVIVCMVALLVVTIGAPVLPLLRAGQRRWSIIGLKALWLLLLASIPFALHLPVALVYLRASQILQRTPQCACCESHLYCDDLVYRILSGFAHTVAPFSENLLDSQFAWLAFIFLLPVAVVALQRRSKPLAWSDLWYMVPALGVSWAIVFLSDSHQW